MLKYRNYINTKEYPSIYKVGTFGNKNKNLEDLKHVDLIRQILAEGSKHM